MIKDLWLVGIGTGAAHHITLEGQEALRKASAVLLPRKGPGKDDLATLRLDILKATGSPAAILPFEMPLRDESLPYAERVSLWHDQIAERWQQTCETNPISGPVALLVWGDPGLYDSTLRIAERLNPKPCIRVIPGITALQALTAAHAIPFNTIDGNVRVTTGRQMRKTGWPDDAQTLCVMLDGECSFLGLKRPDLHIWWGAYLGMANQHLISGPLHEVGDRIQQTRRQLRDAHGWIMDTYLLRPL